LGKKEGREKRMYCVVIVDETRRIQSYRLVVCERKYFLAVAK